MDRAGTVGAHELLEIFDGFCATHDIDYFAIESTLVGAVTYGDFVPGDADIELGMLRASFEQLRGLASREGLLKGADESPALYLNYHFDRVARYWISAEKGTGLPAPGEPVAVLHVFDAVTDDFNLTTFQRFREEAWTKLRARAPRSLRPAIERHIDALARLYGGTPHTEVSLMLERRRRRYPLAHLEHPQRVPFGRGSVMVPNDTRCWVESDRRAEADRTRRVQKDALRILHEVDRVCRENGIEYFLCAGTLLGAIRYGGFIPWDDDIDIGMLRGDYERFCEVAPGAVSPGFFVQNRASDPDVEYLFTKVRLEGTEYVTDYTRYRNQEKGISIDVFPFDRAAVDAPGFAAYAKQVEDLVARHRRVARHRVTEEYPRRRARNLMEAIGHLVMRWRNRPYNARALAETQREYEQLVTRYDGDESADYAVSYVAYLTYIPLADLLPLAELRFEDGVFPVPRNPDPLMRMQFGDYLHEPPEHERHGHSVISWRTSDGHSG